MSSIHYSIKKPDLKVYQVSKRNTLAEKIAWTNCLIIWLCLADGNTGGNSGVAEVKLSDVNWIADDCHRKKAERWWLFLHFNLLTFLLLYSYSFVPTPIQAVIAVREHAIELKRQARIDAQWYANLFKRHALANNSHYGVNNSIEYWINLDLRVLSCNAILS